MKYDACAKYKTLLEIAMFTKYNILAYVNASYEIARNARYEIRFAYEIFRKDKNISILVNLI